MRLRLIALGCALTGTFGFLALPAAAARAEGTTLPVPAMSVSTPKGGYIYGAKVEITVTLHAATPGSAVRVYAQPWGRAATLIGSGHVNARGKFYLRYFVTRATKFTAVFAGNTQNAPATANRSVTVTAKVTDAVTGYYKTTTISGVTYYVFHGSNMLTLHTTVAPNKHGECAQPQTQQHDAGTGWDADTKWGCDWLDSQSHDAAPFRLAQAVGARYRIRADFIHSAADTANLNADGPWVYFVVVK